MTSSEQQFRRTVTLDKRGMDRKTRTIAFSFSSEYPVAREDFDEILSHDDGDMDLSRLRDGHPSDDN